MSTPHCMGCNKPLSYNIREDRWLCDTKDCFFYGIGPKSAAIAVGKHVAQPQPGPTTSTTPSARPLKLREQVREYFRKNPIVRY